MYGTSIKQIEKKIRFPWQSLKKITIAYKKAGNDGIQILINEIYSTLNILSCNFLFEAHTSTYIFDLIM